MTNLLVDEEVTAMGIPATAFLVENVRGMAATEEVIAAAEAEALAALTIATIDEDPDLVAYRELHARVGVRARDIAAPEALRRMLLKAGQLPRIGSVVDLYNAVSLRTRLALGAHDAEHIDGDVHLRLTSGEESFVPLGTDKPKQVRGGEYAYVDEAEDVLCRLEVRQGDKTKVSPETDRCLVIAQGNTSLGAAAVERGAAELGRLFSELGAEVVTPAHRRSGEGPYGAGVG
jgi:DNA/RNA-binding domain of Phe-tRNA-synthetase-like protein